MQQPDQSMQLQPPQPQQQQQLQPPQQLQQGQNTPLTTPNNLNTFGPINPGGKYVPPNLSCNTELTGKWIANDGGVYYIDQRGDKIRWFGSTLFNDDAINSHTGFEYANEALGDITNSNTGNGTQIHLTWNDVVPISDNSLKGALDLFAYPSGAKIVTISAHGGFGASEWTRKC